MTARASKTGNNQNVVRSKIAVGEAELAGTTSIIVADGHKSFEDNRQGEVKTFDNVWWSANFQCMLDNISAVSG
jgi:hypothetical protein